MSGPPPALKVGPYVYRVEHDTYAQNAPWSSIDYAAQTITARFPERATPDARRVTHLHEVLHAVHELAGYNDSAPGWPTNEEIYLGTVQGLLLMVLRDNPDLVAWLVGDDGDRV